MVLYSPRGPGCTIMVLYFLYTSVGTNLVRKGARMMSGLHLRREVGGEEGLIEEVHGNMLGVLFYMPELLRQVNHPYFTCFRVAHIHTFHTSHTTDQI